jgi:hypothetical protein
MKYGVEEYLNRMVVHVDGLILMLSADTIFVSSDFGDTVK